MSKIGWSSVSRKTTSKRGVVYVHGWIEDATQWSDVYSPLVGKTRANHYTVELPGHGSNTSRFEQDAILASARELAHTINTSPEKEWILAGFSLGGIVTSTAIPFIKKPLRHHLVVCSPNHDLLGTGLWRDRIASVIAQAQAKSLDEQWIMTLRKLGTRVLAFKIPQRRSAYRSHLDNIQRNLERIIEQNRPERIFMYLQFAKEILFHNVTPLLQAPGYNVPTTNIVLKGDVYNRIENVYKTTEVTSSVTAKVLTSGYHHSIPHQYNQLLATYLKYLLA